MRKLYAVLVSIMMFASSAAFADVLVAGNSAVDKLVVKGAKNFTLSIPSVPDAAFIDVAIKANGITAYATYHSVTMGDGTAIFNLATGAYTGNLPSTCALPRKMAIDNVNGKLYVPCTTGAEVFDTTTNTKLYEINQGTVSGEHTAIMPDGTLVLVANSGDVSYYPAGQSTPSTTINLGSACRYIIASLDGSKRFVFLTGNYGFIDPQGNVKEGNVVVLSASLGVVDVIQAGYATIEFAAMAGNRIYAPSSDGYLYSIDPVTNVVLDSKLLGGYLTGITFGSDGKLYICNYDTSVLYTVVIGGVPTSDRISRSLVLPANFYPFGITALPPAPKGKKTVTYRYVGPTFDTCGSSNGSSCTGILGSYLT